MKNVIGFVILFWAMAGWACKLAALLYAGWNIDERRRCSLVSQNLRCYTAQLDDIAKSPRKHLPGWNAYILARAMLSFSQGSGAQAGGLG